MKTQHSTAPVVTIRKVQDRDLEAFFGQQQDPDARYLAAFVTDHPDDRAAFDRHWQRLRTDPELTVRIIVYAGRTAGHLGAFDRDGEREVTYWLDRAIWGRGVATEALRQFLEVEQQRPLYARVVEDHIASWPGTDSFSLARRVSTRPVAAPT
ncbi:GNAT family N-acetyltransferase [Deinococcus sonorensis]|uniref:GNAT family N-acetyltransferase n=2 Tax=Deinococcus sonorensis TaxID=309891 RepID=A0AAU7U7G4_9DEIO